jgi:hypothetical protein
MNAMVTGHQETLDLLTAFGGERMSLTGGGGKQPGGPATAAGAAVGQQPVSEWAATTIPIVRAHLTRARDLQTQMAGTGSPQTQQ